MIWEPMRILIQILTIWSNTASFISDAAAEEKLCRSVRKKIVVDKSGCDNTFEEC